MKTILHETENTKKNLRNFLRSRSRPGYESADRGLGKWGMKQDPRGGQWEERSYYINLEDGLSRRRTRRWTLVQNGDGLLKFAIMDLRI